jgi:hypothetical protein
MPSTAIVSPRIAMISSPARTVLASASCIDIAIGSVVLATGTCTREGSFTSSRNAWSTGSRELRSSQARATAAAAASAAPSTPSQEPWPCATACCAASAAIAAPTGPSPHTSQPASAISGSVAHSAAPAATQQSSAAASAGPGALPITPTTMAARTAAAPNHSPRAACPGGAVDASGIGRTLGNREGVSTTSATRCDTGVGARRWRAPSRKSRSQSGPHRNRYPSSKASTVVARSGSSRLPQASHGWLARRGRSSGGAVSGTSVRSAAVSRSDTAPQCVVSVNTRATRPRESKPTINTGTCFTSGLPACPMS